MSNAMTKVIEAIYTKGVLKPVEALDLAEQQRVRLTIEPLDTRSDEERQAALERLIEGLKRSKLRLEGPLPTRDELHERV